MKNIFIIFVLLLFPTAVFAQEHELNTSFRIQIRDTVTNNGNEIVNNFSLRRARLTFSGYSFNENNCFSVQLGLSPLDLGLNDGIITRTPILDYYLDFKHLNDLNLQIGQYKIPFERERILSSGRYGLVDRTVLAGSIDFDRDIGITAYSNDLFHLNMLRYYLGVYSGGGRENNALRNLDEILYIGRLEIHLNGIQGYDQVNFDISEQPNLSLGIGAAYQNNIYRFTSDLVFVWQGLTLEGAVLGRHSYETNSDELGYYIQTNMLVPQRHFSVTTRYSRVFGLSNSDFQEQNEFGIGLNFYFNKHNLKLDVDGILLWNDFPNTTEFLRAQLQVTL